ncbi:chromate resistance protein ChrB domain-containing protein [Sphingomonas mucosissima]|uniref:Chromate resistance exported protein n=1 Tax=Sphingomonas mucosissima TaxID=370959 RepID=A0A245ZJ86_9SPHN|nr:chromate resistance protein ChrB domain-containing protein [Sphingomonas mucosissima]OWK29811.1 chromate resistance exported protein [Sphingomonas mucosissima]
MPESPFPWLLLIPQLPAKPAYLRVKVWRRLQAIGAAPLKNAVHALPRRAETLALFAALHREITANGGEALILEARIVEGMSDADLRVQFDTARDADYEELTGEAAGLAEADYVASADIARLRRRLVEIAAIDFFGAHGRQGAEAAIAQAEDRARRHPDVSGPGAPALAPDALQARTWVTRRHIHVDRIASAWLIRRFIDPAATFRFVEGQDYQPASGELRFDMAGAEFTHEADRCTFETLLLRCGLGEDAALRALGEIIHDLDIADARFNRPEAAGVEALINGICAASDDDTQRLAQGSAALDGLYAHFTKKRGD